MNRTISFVKIIITVIIPVLLIMSAIRVLMNPWYPEFEYRLPNFPADTYGFNMDERLKWAKTSIEYLTNDADLTFLSDLKLSDTQTLYNTNELSHMLDVKNLVQAMILAWNILVVVLLGVGLWAWRTKWLCDFWDAISRGGWYTLGLIAAILVAVAVSFNDLFTAFHRLFFVGDTWLFRYSDSLIRLFPIKFWQDAFIYVGIFSIAGGILLGVIGKKLSR